MLGLLFTSQAFVVSRKQESDYGSFAGYVEGCRQHVNKKQLHKIDIWTNFIQLIDEIDLFLLYSFMVI